MSPVSFTVLAVICLVGLLGPILALPTGWHLPVVLGELAAGIALGVTGLGYLDPTDTTFAFLADIGFALVMFVAGSHVPLRDARLRPALRSGAARALLVGVAAAALGYLVAGLFGTDHAWLYAVLFASSSAALILPTVDSLGLTGSHPVSLFPQVAIADTVCIVLVPLVIEPAHALRALAGTLLVLAAGVAAWALLAWGERSGAHRRIHDVSEERSFALELRITLVLLFVLAAVATETRVSVMLAGFAMGLAVAAIGEPRRLAGQLFALTEGLFGPLFFIWLGATLDLRALFGEPHYLLLGVALGGGAVVAHLAGCLIGQTPAYALIASAQLGVPVAAATIGTQLGVLTAGAASALMLGALITVGAMIAGGTMGART